MLFEVISTARDAAHLAFPGNPAGLDTEAVIIMIGCKVI